MDSTKEIMQNLPMLFTPLQIAKIMNISRSKVYELMNNGELNSCKIGRSRRISDNQIETYIQKLTKVTT